MPVVREKVQGVKPLSAKVLLPLQVLIGVIRKIIADIRHLIPFSVSSEYEINYSLKKRPLVSPSQLVD
jgi:hypothetical protein